MDEEQMKQKEQEELKALLDAPGDEEPAVEPTKDDENSEENDDSKDESKSEKKDKTMNDKDKSKDKKKDENDQDRWHGKSREEIIKELEALEKDKKPETGEEDENKEGDDENEELNIPSAEELQKMTPSDFAKWVLTRIDEGVKQTIEIQEKVRTAVQKEIEEAKKDHPLHEPDYRKMVQTIIDAASAKGTTVSLKEACMQVDAFLGKHKTDAEENDEGESEELSDKEKSRLKKAKAQVESGAGAPTQPESSDAETKRIQKALTGSGSKSSLGGLGI